MPTKNRLVSFDIKDIGYWIKNHWFLCLVIVGFIYLWNASGASFLEALTGNIYPALLLLIPLLVTFLLAFLVIIYSDMAT